MPINEAMVGIWPYVGLLAFCSLTCGLIVASKTVIGILSRISRRVWFLLIAVIIGGAILRLFYTPWMPRVSYDEWDYIQAGRMILYEGKHALCNVGAPGDCMHAVPSPHLVGYPLILSFIFSIFGSGFQTAMGLNAYLSILSIPLIFLTTYLMFGSERSALFSSIIFAVHPLSLMFSTTAVAETSTIFFTLLFLFTLGLFIKTPSRITAFTMVSALSVAVLFRLEAQFLVLLGLISLVLLAFRSRYLIKGRKLAVGRSLPFAFAFIVSESMVLIHLFLSVPTQQWTNHGIISVGNVLRNTWYLLAPFSSIPFILACFLVVGLAIILVSPTRRRLGWQLMVLYGMSLILYLTYPFAGVSRFIFTLSIPLIISSGLAITLIDRFVPLLKVIVTSMLIISIVLAVPSSISIANTFDEDAKYTHIGMAYLDSCGFEDGYEGYIVSSNPSFTNIQTGVPSIQTGELNSIEFMLANGSDILMFHDSVCGSDLYRVYCDNVYDNFLVEEFDGCFGDEASDSTGGIGLKMFRLKQKNVVRLGIDSIEINTDIIEGGEN